MNFTPPPNVQAKDIRGAFVFVVDGVNARIFQQMLEAGDLPNFRAYFADHGLYAPRAVANIPSVTLPNLVSLSRGRFCGHHGVIGNNWYDRRESLFRNYDTIEQKDLLDGDSVGATLFDNSSGRFSVSVFFLPHRGAAKFYENWMSAGPAFYFGWYLYIDRLTLFRFGEMMVLARERGVYPSLVVTYLLAPDYQAYRHGAGSEAYRQAIRHTDRQIGRVLGDLKRAGLLENFLIAVVSDHSHSDIKEHFDLGQFLTDKAGLRFAKRRFWEDTSLKRREEYYKQFNAALTGSGERYRGVTLLGDEASDRRSKLIPLLIDQPAVDALAWPTEQNRVRVRTKRGEAEFHQPDGPRGEITYCVTFGTDPFGWDKALPSDRPLRLSPRDWLEATHKTDYPDLPPQILAYFRSQRAEDLVAFAAPGWDFGGTHKGGHGGLRAEEDMFVPMLLAGPGVPHGRVEVARTVDLCPTILEWLNGRPLEDIDGMPLKKD